MKKLFIFSLVLVMVFAVSMVSLVQGQETASGSIDAQVTAATGVEPINENNGLNFGVIARSDEGGTVTVNPNGTGNYTTNNIVIISDASIEPAQFVVSGDPNAEYNVSLPFDDVTITNAQDNATMVVSDFTTDFSGSRTIGSDGTSIFNVGATLQVGANQTVGRYTGTFQVTVTFQ